MVPDRKLYLTGKVRVYETRLFDRGAFSRFLENKSMKGFISELKDTPYGFYLAEGNLPGALDHIVNDAYREFAGDMGKDAVILKAFMLKRKASKFVEYFKEFRDNEAGNEKNIRFPHEYGISLREIKKFINSDESLTDRKTEKFFISFVVKKYLNKFSSSRLKKLWQHQIDIKNLLNNIRHIEPGHYLPGGSIEASFWSSVDCRKEMPAKVKAMPFMKEAGGGDEFNSFETHFERWIGKQLKDLRKITFGPEAVCSYLLSLISETKNLLFAYTGLKIGMKSEEIRKHINFSYI